PYFSFTKCNFNRSKKYSSYSEIKATAFRMDPESNLALLLVEKKDFFSRFSSS
ncbi:hypothetical protein LEP1GSC124_0354, partial [Leptospira interrogans serovar Pyrogenes str. 200701872]